MKAAAREDYEVLEGKLGHGFADRSLLRRALTHASVAVSRADSYERLEFLGDRVLGLVVAHMLVEAFPDESEGTLSRRLASLVRKETCAEVARDWGVGAFIRLGEGEAQSGGRDKRAILGDVCEAVIGAVFLDAGLDVADRVVRAGFCGRMSASARAPSDAKTLLQEWAQGRRLAPPTYLLAARSGPDHAPFFEIQVDIDGYQPAHGTGASKRAAEQAAALNFLSRERIYEGSA
ncbi:MAG TPA: ribonuclease III [Methylocystis sp.]|nr:ribonuclease III [Methylocystis sp.]